MSHFHPHSWVLSTVASMVVELQINEANEMARYRITQRLTVFKGRWQPIRYSKNGRPYIRDWHGNVAKGTPSRKYKMLYLDEFMRYYKP